MPVWDRFTAARREAMPAAYLIPDRLQTVVELLRRHGITVSALPSGWKAPAEQFSIDSVRRSRNRFEGHNTLTVEGHWAARRRQRERLLVPGLDDATARRARGLPAGAGFGGRRRDLESARHRHGRGFQLPHPPAPEPAAGPLNRETAGIFTRYIPAPGRIGRAHCCRAGATIIAVRIRFATCQSPRRSSPPAQPPRPAPRPRPRPARGRPASPVTRSSAPVSGTSGNARQLTFGGNNAEAYFSPDGRQLIFQRQDSVDTGCDQQYIMNTDGSDVRRVSNGAGPHHLRLLLRRRPARPLQLARFEDAPRVPAAAGPVARATSGRSNTLEIYTARARTGAISGG